MCMEFIFLIMIIIFKISQVYSFGSGNEFHYKIDLPLKMSCCDVTFKKDHSFLKFSQMIRKIRYNNEMRIESKYINILL